MRAEAEKAVRRAEADPAPGAPPNRHRAPKLAPDVLEELVAAVGERRAGVLAERLDDALRAFDRDRYPEARRLLAPIAEQAPSAAAVREFHGLTLYRLGRWREAAKELEAYRALTGEVDQHPVLADCYRALRRWTRVDELWAELREASPSAEVVAEGRIVYAGSLADRGDLKAAIAALEPTAAVPARVRPHHLRLWYVLADLYDRAGDAPRARALFRRVREVDPSFADVDERLRSLGR